MSLDRYFVGVPDRIDIRPGMVFDGGLDEIVEHLVR